jgi:hypothetical protein
LTNIYEVLVKKVTGADAIKDLKWWSLQYGPGMAKKWPEFEVRFSSILVICCAVYTVLCEKRNEKELAYTDLNYTILHNLFNDNARAVWRVVHTVVQNKFVISTH